MKVHTLARTVVTAAAILLATSSLAACSDSDSEGGDATPNTAAAPAGDPIKIGFICSCTGPQSASLGGTDDVARAWEASINAAGGINGSPVKVLVKDDGLDPAKSLQAAKELVENEGVMAIVGDSSVVDTSWADYVKEKNIPVVGGMPVNTPPTNNPAFYATGPSLPIEFLAINKIAKEAGSKKISLLYCAESPLCANTATLAEGIAELQGLDFISSKVDASSPNYAAVCLAQEKEDVDALFVLTDALVGQRVVDDCAKQGYKPHLALTVGSSSVAWPKDENFDGAQLTASGALYTDDSIPAVKEFSDALQEHAPDVIDSDNFNYPTIWAWTGFKLFEKVATTASLSPTSTPADVTAGLLALKDETLGGLTAPLNYVAGQPTFIPCYFTVEITDSKFVGQNDGQPTCFSDSEVAAFKKLLAGG
jgi:branched-chain amino acid transport system substrate-binding protein